MFKLDGHAGSQKSAYPSRFTQEKAEQSARESAA